MDAERSRSRWHRNTSPCEARPRPERHHEPGQTAPRRGSSVTAAPAEQLHHRPMCPNIRRPAWPADRGTYPESDAPSVIAFLALALHDGRLDPAADLTAKLVALDVAEVCRPACPYDVDVPSSVRVLFPL